MTARKTAAKPAAKKTEVDPFADAGKGRPTPPPTTEEGPSQTTRAPVRATDLQAESSDVSSGPTVKATDENEPVGGDRVPPAPGVDVPSADVQVESEDEGHPDLPASYHTEEGEYLVNVARPWGPIVVSVIPKGWHGAPPLQLPLEDLDQLIKALQLAQKKHKGQG